MVVTVTVWRRVVMWMHVPSKVPDRLVAVVDVVVVVYCPPNGERRVVGLTDAVIELQSEFTRTQHVVQRPTRQRVEALELGTGIAECASVDGTAERM